MKGIKFHLEIEENVGLGTWNVEDRKPISPFACTKLS
jgi:hypothetical protein